MPIEFHCPGCGKLMRTPDETAGRKGRCPNCGIKVQIPVASLTSSSDTNKPEMQSNPNSAGISRSPASAASPAPIQFGCPSCGRQLSVPAANAGKKGRCPHCAAITLIPLASTPTSASSSAASGNSARPTPRPKPSSESRWKNEPRPVDKPSPASKPIQFTCPACRKVLQVADASRGKQVNCPKCQALVTVPVQANASSPTLAPAPNSSGLVPLPSSPQQLGSSGLTPLPSATQPAMPSGLTPLPAPNAPSADSGLTPLPSPAAPRANSGLTPIMDTGLILLDGPATAPNYQWSPVPASDPTFPDLGAMAGPLGPAAPFGQGFGDVANENPFTTAGGSSQASTFRKYVRPIGSSEVREAVIGASISLMGVSILSLLVLGLWMAFTIFQIVLISQMAARHGVELDWTWGVASRVGACGLLIGISAYTFWGGLQMKRMENYSHARAAAILACIPCIAPCYCLGLPSGIWALSVLSRSDVSNAFRS